MEQYIILQKGEQGYHIEFMPPVDGGDRRIEDQEFTFDFISAGNFDESIIAINQLFQLGLFDGLETIVMEGASMSSDEERRLEIFCKVCNDDYEPLVKYNQYTEN